MLLLAGVLRLGFVANFISEPVLVGFKAGIGIVIVVDQVPKLLGIHFDKGNFLQNVAGDRRRTCRTRRCRRSPWRWRSIAHPGRVRTLRAAAPRRR